MAEFKKREQINLPYFNAQTDAVAALDFSFDARYLAVAYSNGADVWDLDKTNTVPISTTHGRRVTGRIRSLAWFPTRHRLILAHDSGVVYVVTFGINSVATAGVREPGFHQNAVSIAVLNDNLFAVAFTKTVQIRYERPGSQDSLEGDWALLGCLKSPPAIQGLSISSLTIDSIHTIKDQRLLVSYGKMIIVEWLILSVEPFYANIQKLIHAPGSVTDVSSNDSYLISDNAAGSYQLFSLLYSSSVTFIPRYPGTDMAQQISAAKFLGRDLIIGGGNGQLVLWNTEASRLQNLKVDIDKRSHALIEKFCCIYKASSDVAYIAAVVGGSSQMIIWEWNGSSALEPKQHRETVLNHVSVQHKVRKCRLNLNLGVMFLILMTVFVVILKYRIDN
ncbi:hypothetical protein C8J55DRAFT_567801 [Lentinula edodes]|uniref:WD40 repeat-like protein n=1 Tax=Lentinula lateritia TaxID=40482 RepID=A0A9W8ZNL2_9AGAR|nr:hypothetical protein C8J55DRAFT_567801 [Lentinula edodes]